MNKIFFIFCCTVPTLQASNIIEQKLNYLNMLIPLGTELRERVLTTIYCDDCKDLPLVENSGKIIKNLDINYQLMHNGLKIIHDCYYGSWMTTLITLLKGYHEPQEEKSFHTLLPHIKSGGTMIELGSYWGYYSMWFQQHIPHATNYLIEPDPKNLTMGKRNFALNNMTGRFTHAQIGNKSLKQSTFTDWDYNTHTIPQVSIDDFCASNNISFVDILHSDIQGAEVDMLHGCKRMLSQKKIGCFFISTHKNLHPICLEMVKKAGLEIIVEHTREESFSADGLIVAALPEFFPPVNISLSRRTQKLQASIHTIFQAE